MPASAERVFINHLIDIIQHPFYTPPGAAGNLVKPKRLRSSRSRPASGRGEATRERLLEVAIRVFAARGFDGARTRDIAEAAKTNPVSIAYYYGNKQGLYHAAALHVAACWAAYQKPLVQQARTSMARAGITRRELVGIVCTLLCGFVRLILGNFLPDCYGKFVGQAASGPAREFSVIEGGLAPLRGTLAEAIARLTGESAVASATQVRALSIIGSCVCFRRDRRAVLHALKWKQIGAKELKVIEAGVRANIQAMFSRSG
jgi:AcrR family transcriptional regulator